MSNQNKEHQQMPDSQSDESVDNQIDNLANGAVNSEVNSANAEKPAADEASPIQSGEAQDEAENLDPVALKRALAEAEAKVNDNWERYLAAKAETDNIRKRAERDIANAHKYALDKFIPELLTVKDSLELGAKAAHESLADSENDQMVTFIEGSDMAITMFGDILKKFGVETVSPEGEPFNPEWHQAMTMVTNSELPANTVIEVIQKGYVLNQRLIRPAMVIVSKAD